MFNESNNWLINANNTIHDSHKRVSDVFYVRGVASISLALITSVANGLVILLFMKDPHKKIRKSPTNILVTSLALVDFIVGFVLEPVGAYWYLTTYFRRRQLFDHKYLEIAEAFLLLVSVFHLLGITRDRYLAILNPLRYCSQRKPCKRRSYSTVFFIWLYCSVLVLGLRFIGKNYIRNILFCLHVDLAVIVSVALFCCIMRSLHRQTLCLQSLNVMQVIAARSIHRERKVTKTMGLMLAVFLICTLPWFLLMQILPLCSACKQNLDVLIWVFKLCFVLFQANCAFNPFLCAWRLPKYRAAISYLLYARKQTFSRSSFRETTSASLQAYSSSRTNFSDLAMSSHF